MNSSLKRFSLWIYVSLLFIVQALSIIIPTELVSLYLSVSIFVMGFTAILFQKRIDGNPIKAMGFTLGRNAYLSVGIGILYFGVVILLMWIVPVSLGFAHLIPNPVPPYLQYGVTPQVYLLLLILTDGTLMFVSALFGEELAHRGYVLPKLEHLGRWKAVFLSSVIFALWHLPVYFSLYTGGAAAAGAGSLAIMIFGHFISVIPLAILYVTTHSLYGVSLVHAASDLVEYEIIGNAGLGAASAGALYFIYAADSVLMTLYGWIVGGILILLMTAICWITRRRWIEASQ
jgi:membrane protease YdiL (CAAX protease family)